MFIGSKKHQSTVIEASNNLIKMQLKEKVAIDRTNLCMFNTNTNDNIFQTTNANQMKPYNNKKIAKDFNVKIFAVQLVNWLKDERKMK